jgi:hypothetical protein
MEQARKRGELEESKRHFSHILPPLGFLSRACDDDDSSHSGVTVTIGIEDDSKRTR